MTPAASSASEASEADERLDQALQALVARADGPPAVWAVVQRGKDRELHSVGRADINSSAPPRLNDHTRIASISKAFSAAVALRLVEKGKLKLSTTIGEVLPTLPASWSAVTVRQLLQHTSGLPDYFQDPEFGAWLGSHLKDYIAPFAAISYVFDEPPEFAPGSQYHYSNTDNIVVGLIAEQVTSRPYERLLRKLVLRPLRLKDTSFPSGFEMPEPFVHGYFNEGPPEPIEDLSEALSVSSGWAVGAIVSTARDLNVFIRAWGGGSLLGPKMRRAQTRFFSGAGGQPPGPGQNSGGLALYRYSQPCGKVFGHTGNFPGYTAFAASNRRGNRSTVVFASSQLSVGTGPQQSFAQLHEIFGLASCAALARD
jgi:D-alanyl-D-alanine carboxypeptidase